MLQRLIISCVFYFFSTLFNNQTPLAKPFVDINNEIAFIADTQAPLWFEKILSKTDDNRTATKMIFMNIIERHPLSLFLLGDVVSLGSSNRSWKQMDTYLEKCRSKGIQVYAALGNHEVMGTRQMDRKGEKKFQTHFPEHVHTGFAEIMDSLAVVLLNSNFSRLTKSEDEAQIEWYKNILKRLDKDPSVQYIITGCHHSPYSNSKIVGSSKAVQQKFVTLFMRSIKSCLFLSGHSHAFEHFKKNGKDFLVIGGGGGIHQTLRESSGNLLDLSPDYKPMFHYLTVRRLNDHLLITSYKLKEDLTGFVSGLIMNINLPKEE